MAAAAPLAIAQIASTVLAVGSTAYGAYSARQTAKAQAQQANQNAQMAESQGRVEAERIRDLGRKQRSAAQAQMAMNGLDLNAENTVVDTIDNDITFNSSKDAWTTFFNSQSQANQYRTDANAYDAQGKSAVVSGLMNMGSSALSGYTNFKGNKFNLQSNTQSISEIPSSALTMDTSRLKNNSNGWA